MVETISLEDPDSIAASTGAAKLSEAFKRRVKTMYQIQEMMRTELRTIWRKENERSGMVISKSRSRGT